MDTDVNIPALYEYNLARAANDPLVKESLCYITVGTGVGIGLIINGKTVHGMMHPEGGHARVPIDPREEETYGFMGVCPFHGNCLEGLVSNNAIQQRLKLENNGEAVKNLPDDHEVWDILAGYMGTF